MSEENIVVWDLGATKCAAGLVSYNYDNKKLMCKNKCTIKLRLVNSLEELVNQIEKELDFKHKDSQAVCVGAAGIYDGQVLNLEKAYPYEMVFKEVAQKYKWPRFDIIHDYALILGATFISDIRVKKINQYDGDIFGRRVAFGVGTGLGLKDGVLLKNGDFWMGTNEFGHVGLSYPIEAPKELLDLHQLLTAQEKLSFEDILSGKGMLRIHKFLHTRTSIKTPEELGELIRGGAAKETITLFAFYLGLFTATVQLSLMPTGGIWIAGGVVLNHLEIFDCPEFEQGIRALPAYLSERRGIPLRVLVDPDAAFIGGAWYALKRLS